MSSRHITAALLAFTLLAASNGLAREFLMPEEVAERELQRRREAQPVLACAPITLRTTLRQGETKSFKLMVNNAGGRTLNWKVKSKTGIVRLDTNSGSLEFGLRRYVNVTVSAEGLAVGVVRGGIVLEAPGAAGSPLTVPIILDVRPKAKPAPPKPPTKPDRRPRSSRSRKPGRSARKGAFGVRAGLLMPGSAEEASYDTGFLVGVSYDLPFWRTETLSVGAAVDFGSVSGSADGVESDVVVLSAAARFAPGGKAFYVAGGGSLLFDNYMDEVYGLQGSNVISMLGLGAGYRRTNKSLDVRFTYSVLLGSKNVGGLISLTAGIAF